MIVKLKLVRYDWNGNIGFVSFELDLAARRRLIVTLGLVFSALSWNCSSYRAVLEKVAEAAYCSDSRRSLDHHSGITEDVVSVIWRTVGMLVLAKAAFVVQCDMVDRFIVALCNGFCLWLWCRCVTFQPSHLCEQP